MRSGDQQIIVEMAEAFAAKGHLDPKVKAVLISDAELSSDEVTMLLKYISECQAAELKSETGELTIRNMKKNIFNLIGGTPSRGCTVSRSDLVSMYNFITKLPHGYFITGKIDDTHTV